VKGETVFQWCFALAVVMVIWVGGESIRRNEVRYRLQDAEEQASKPKCGYADTAVVMTCPDYYPIRYRPAKQPEYYYNGEEAQNGF
jgi:hypothetical protein